MLLKVLIGYDFTEASEIALRQAIFLCERLGASELHVASILDNDLLRRGIVERLTEEQADALRTRVRTTVQRRSSGSPHKHMRVCIHTPIGYPDEELLTLASTVEADVIVVGTHGRSGIARLIMGSVAEAVTRNANCPVFIARNKDYPQPEKKIPRPEPATPGRPAPPYMEPHLYRPNNWAPVQAPEWPIS